MGTRYMSGSLDYYPRGSIAPGQTRLRGSQRRKCFYRKVEVSREGTWRRTQKSPGASSATHCRMRLDFIFTMGFSFKVINAWSQHKSERQEIAFQQPRTKCGVSQAELCWQTTPPLKRSQLRVHKGTQDHLCQISRGLHKLIS